MLDVVAVPAVKNRAERDVTVERRYAIQSSAARGGCYGTLVTTVIALARKEIPKVRLASSI